MRHVAFLVLAPLSMLACSGKDDSAASCDLTLADTIPTEGATDAYYRDPIEFGLSSDDAKATITLSGPSGDVSGKTSHDDAATRIFFTPDAPLEPVTNYTATLHSCGGDFDVHFTTSDFGSAMSDVTLLDGKVYAADLTKARWVEPGDISSLIASQLKSNFLFDPTTNTASTLVLLSAMSTDDKTSQDFCGRTVVFPDLGFSEHPYFDFGPADASIGMMGADIAFQDMTIQGTFSADGTRMGGVTLAAFLDTRPLVALLLGSDDDNAICALGTGLGLSCEACDDGEPYCTHVLLRDITATVDPGIPALEPIDQADCNVQCPTNDPETCPL